MPLTRYQIRNEFSLADPELYRSADKDDPEALLEGVAMSGLVGVLRQLGDLAEFAAEMFHDLHEEVMATAARGHAQMARVKQLEAEFPSIEKSFLSQTDHSLFFTNAGVDWHPILRTEHNMITHGDLPRCVLDSYEECRGPPRLFLLDKFDVAGAGACLKRYTDPSFFKAESAFPGIAPLEVQREKKVRKVKKKGSRWKNGDTPEFPQTSHAKLHQLFLEEHIDNAYNDPARLVKLKRRQLNESPLDSKSGKTYMEKFLESPPAQKKAVYEISGTLPLRLTVDSSSELGPETLDISATSPVKVSSQGKKTSSSSPTVHEIVLKPSLGELNEEAIDREIMKVPEPTFAFRDGIPHSLHKVTTEEEIILDGEGMEECNIYGDHSDGMSSEADNFIDAISTMESEMDTDNEYRPKGGVDFVDIGKYQTGSHANEEKFGVQAHSSDSQSDRISSLSDDRSCSTEKGISSFSNSDTIDNLAKDMPSDGEVAAEVFPSNRNSVTEIVEMPPIQLPTCLEIQCPSSDQVLLPEDISFGVRCLPDLGEASYSSCLEDLNSTCILLDDASAEANPSLEQQHEEVPSDGKTRSNLSDSDGGKYLDDSSEVYFADSSEKQVTLITLSAESHPVDELSIVDANVLSDALPYLLNVLQVAPEKESDNGLLNEILKTDSAGEICAENSVNQTIGSPHSNISSKEEQHLCSTLAKGERSSGIIQSPEHLDVAKPINFGAEVRDPTGEVDLNLECTSHVVDTSQICGINEQQFSDLLHNDPKVESHLIEIEASYSEQKQFVDELFDATEGEETRIFTCSGNVVEEDGIPCDLPYDCADNLNLKDHVDLEYLATENVCAGSTAASAAACDSANTGDDVDNTTYHSSNLICSPSEKLMNLEVPLAGDGDICHEGLESNEIVSKECLTELEIQEETNQVVGPQADIDSTSCKSVSNNNSNLEDEVHYSSLAEPTNDSLNFIDLTAAPASSEFSDKESELKYSSHLKESMEDTLCSPTHYQSEKENSLLLSLDIHTNQHDVEKLHIIEDGSRQIKSLDPVDQEKCLRTSFEHSKEGSSSQTSLDFSEQSGRQDKQESYPSDPIHPALCLHPEATKGIMEEMPPLPPLPPMQWRIGRVQHVSTAPQRELVEHGQLATDFMQPSPFSMHLATMASNSNSQYNGFCSDRTHSDPFATLPTTSNEKLEYGLFSMEDDRVESSYSYPMPPTDATGRHIPVSLHEETANCPDQFVLDTSLEGVSCQDPKQNFVREYGDPPDVFVPLPTKREEQIPAKVAEDLPAKVVEQISAKVSEDLPAKVEEQIPAKVSEDLPAKVEEQFPTKVSEDLPDKVEEQFPTKVDKQPQHGLAASEGEMAQTPNAIVQHGLAAPVGETSQINTTLEHDLSTSEGEAAWPSNMLALVQVAEEGNSSGNPPVKLPRPRNPLIDAVAAHGKSKLRKVTEQNRPPIISKVDERDSLLEQIRTKSFNLKPAAVTRPRVQGPKTNMRVAAILEKANAIRQALAGSDEDDDEDGWSDS